ncbi:MAG: hypothetical protein ACFE8J_07365 [Candidatus Heimdallarchaeota archaeon]
MFNFLMNKFGFFLGIFTILMVFFQFIPLGINFGVQGVSSIWMLTYFGVKNPLLSSFFKFPLEIFTYGNRQVFLWGMIIDDELYPWFEMNILSFIFLFIISLFIAILSIVGSIKENLLGKRLITISLIALIIVFLYSIIGIPIYSQEILGTQFGYFDIFLYLNYGFFVLVLNLILALIAYIKHPINE